MGYPWVLPGLFIVPGAFLIIVSYLALIESDRKGAHISGFPLLGGILIFTGFILSPVKWLAFLCLADYGFWMMPYSLWEHSTRSGRAYAKRKQDKLISSLSPDMRSILDRELSSGNSIRNILNIRRTPGGARYLTIYLACGFKNETGDLPGIEMVQTESGRLEYVDDRSCQAIVGGYENKDEV